MDPTEPPPRALTAAVGRLAVAQVLVLCLWFSVAAVLPGLARAHGLAVVDLAHLSSMTQLGFVAGAIGLAMSGLADRVDPRRVFIVTTLIAAISNLALLFVAPTGVTAALSRLVVGAALAGVYPVGLKLAIGWTIERRGLVVSVLVGALTLGSSTPHLVALLGGADPSTTLATTSGLASLSAILIAGIGLGPFHAKSPRAKPQDLAIAFSDPGIRRAYFGYFGHMWELYAFWAWIGVAARSAAEAAGLEDPSRFGSGLAFTTIALGGLACIPSGRWADRYGKDAVARGALVGSFGCGLATVLGYAWGLVPFTVAAILWGITVIPDSPQFSAMVADAAPPEKAGSLMALQTALGFALTIGSVQLTPWVADRAGWPAAFAILLIGPLAGWFALRSTGSAAVRSRGRCPPSHLQKEDQLK